MILVELVRGDVYCSVLVWRIAAVPSIAWQLLVFYTSLGQSTWSIITTSIFIVQPITDSQLLGRI